MGKGAGPSPTAISLLTDIVDIAQGKSTPVDSADAFLSRTAKSASGGDSVARYYLRLSVPDRPGVLAQVSSLFAKQEISIASVLQPETAQAAERVPLILTTHPARGSGIASLLAALGTEHWGKPVLLRIIED
jgi:homoserine dehydrogenase